MGQIPPKAIRVDQAPPNVPEPGVITDSEIILPEQLSALLSAYRLTLIEMLHVVPAELAEQYADTEIMNLQRQYKGQDDELRHELGRRLREAQPHYGPLPPPGGEKALHPDDQGSLR